MRHALLLFVAGLAATSPAAAISCGDVLVADTTLTGDLSCPSTALIFGAHDITLDCDGHTLQGAGVGAGVEAVLWNGITVRNCLIRGFEDGVFLRSALNATLLDNVAEENLTSGFSLFGSDGGFLSGNSATGTGIEPFTWGFQVTHYQGGGGDNVVLENNFASRYLVGFLVHTDGNRLTGNTSTGNNSGFGFTSVSRGNIVIGNTGHFNEVCIGIGTRSDDNLVQANECRWGTFGFQIVSISARNIIEDNTIRDFTVRGIWVASDSNDNIFRRNMLENNTIGIEVGGLSGDPIVGTLVYDNFFANITNAVDPDGMTTWDVEPTPGPNVIGGPVIGGNFWSDYAGSDLNADGLGDTLLPYTGGGIAMGGDFAPLVPGASPDVFALLQGLRDDVAGSTIASGSRNALLSKLDNAIRHLQKGKIDQTRKSLGAFIQEVEAQSGKKIPVLQADRWIRDAQVILALL